MNKTRSVIMFEEYIHTEKTREAYTFQINKFRDWLGLKTWDDILAIDSQELREKIEDYVILLKNKPVSSNYVLTNHIHFQNDNEFIEGISRDKELMIQLMEKDVREKLSFDQSKFDADTAEWLMEKYQRYNEYKNWLKEIIYV